MRHFILSLLICSSAILAQESSTSSSIEPQAEELSQIITKAIKSNDVTLLKKTLRGGATFSLTLLHESVIANSFDCFAFIVSLIPPSQSKLIDCHDENGYSSLHLAALHNRVTLIEALIKAGANIQDRVESTTNRNAHIGSKAIHLAQSPEAIQILYNADAWITEPNYNEKTPLQLAASREKADCIRLLRTLSLQCLPKKEVIAAFATAIENEDIESIKALTERLYTKSFVFNNQIEEQWATIKEIDKALNDTESGPHLDDKTKTFLSALKEKISRQLKLDRALLTAAQQGQADTVRDLIKQGAHIEVRGEALTPPIHFAALCPTTDCLKALIDLGAQIDSIGHFCDDHNEPTYPSNYAGNIYRVTPLASACRSGRFEAVKILLEQGANITTILDTDGPSFTIAPNLLVGNSCRDFVVAQGTSSAFLKALLPTKTALLKTAPPVAHVKEALLRVWATIHALGITNNLPPYVLLGLIQSKEELRTDLATLLHYHLSHEAADLYELLFGELKRETVCRASLLHKNRATFWKYMAVFLGNSADYLVPILISKTSDLFRDLPKRAHTADTVPVLSGSAVKGELKAFIVQRLKECNQGKPSSYITS